MIDDRIRIQQYLDKSYEQEFHMVKGRQITLLEKIKTSNMKIQSHYSLVETIVNISKQQLTTQEKSVLNKGLNFATTIIKMKIIVRKPSMMIRKNILLPHGEVMFSTNK